MLTRKKFFVKVSKMSQERAGHSKISPQQEQAHTQLSQQGEMETKKPNVQLGSELRQPTGEMDPIKDKDLIEYLVEHSHDNPSGRTSHT